MSHCSSETRGHSLNASPSKRVFSMPPPKKAPLNTPGTPVLEDFPQNDDEKERLQRRRSRAFELQFSIDSPRLLASPSSRWVCSGLPPGVAHHSDMVHGPGISTLPRAFWVLILKSYSIMDPCQSFLFFVFHLGILTFQLQFQNLQTHRLQSIIPPVSNYPLKTWVSAGVYQWSFCSLSTGEIKPWVYRECMIHNNCISILQRLLLVLVLSLWLYCFLYMFGVPSDRLPVTCSISAWLGDNSVGSGADSRVVELNVSFRAHLNWNPVSATYKLCGLGKSLNHLLQDPL